MAAMCSTINPHADPAVLGAGNQLNFPTRTARSVADITGSVEEKKKAKKKSERRRRQEGRQAEAGARRNRTLAAAESGEARRRNSLYPAPGAPVSASERAILERLQSRRQELEARAREIDIRESLLKAAEKARRIARSRN